MERHRLAVSSHIHRKRFSGESAFDVLEVLIQLDDRDERLVIGLRATVRFLAQ